MKAINSGGMLMLALALTCHAQSSQQIAKLLPESGQAKIQRLSELSQLPNPVWRYHEADMPHGESVDLDDSGWAVAKPNSDFPTGALWLRQWVEVPKALHGYDLTGSQIWFEISVGARLPMSEIVYVNGNRMALGEAIEPVLAVSNARPGEKVLIAVKLPATIQPKHFAGSTLKVHFATARPDPEVLRDEILSATVLLPSIVSNPAQDQARVDKALAEIDTAALDSGNQAEFDASLREAQGTLAELRPVMQQMDMHLTGNSHIDAAWLWPWTETVDVVHRTFATALQLMSEYPTYTYTQSAAQYNAWMAQKYPEINDEIAKRIKEGRWEVVGGMWVEPDLNLPDGESTARSILIGKRWYQQHYGVDVRIGWNPDSFGYNWQLPQIYKRSGIDYFVTQKMSWNDTNKLPLKLFWWESPDGSKVLTYFPAGYANRSLDPVRLSSNMARARADAPGMTEMMDLYGVGDHGGGPTREMLDQALDWMQPDKVAPKMQFGTAGTFFSTVEKEIAPQSPTWDYRSIAAGYHAPNPVAGEIAIPTWKDELYLEYHRGVYTTQANQKRNLRESSEWALDAEKYASLAWLDGNKYPGDALTEDWKKITFNDFHDLAAGSGIAQVYKDAQKDFDVVRWSTNEISSKALDTIAARVDTRGASGVPVFIFNPLAWSRSGHVEVKVQMPSATATISVLDPHGKVLPSEVLSRDSTTNTFDLLVDAENVPSMGYEVLHVVPGHRAFASDLHVNGMTLENAALRVTVDPTTGCITSLYDKKGGFETLVVGSCGNELQAFKDTPKIYDAWNIDPGTLDRPPTRLDHADSVAVVEHGPMRGVIRIVRTWQHSKFVQEIVLYEGSDQAEVVNDIDWHETHVLLKAAFKLSATSPFATYEIPYGSIERPTTRNNSWEKAKFEVPAQRWADLGDQRHGFSLINDSKFGYDGVGNMLRLTLLRSPVWPDQNADRGHQHFRYALYPHSGTWQQAMTVRHGYDFNYGLMAMQTEPHIGVMGPEHSFVSTSSSNVVITAMKKAEDSNALVFHLYEWKGERHDVEIQVPSGATGAVETNLMEQPEGTPLTLKNDRLIIPVKPFEIVAVRVDYPVKNQQETDGTAAPTVTQ